MFAGVVPYAAIVGCVLLGAVIYAWRRDLAEAEEDVQDFQGEVAIAVRSACEANSPRRTGDLAKSWAVSAGGPDKNLKEGSDAQAAAVVASARPGQSLFVQSNDFRASFFENGTVHMSPRPIVAPAIAAVEGMQK